jgi:hypothetical protein
MAARAFFGGSGSAFPLALTTGLTADAENPPRGMEAAAPTPQMTGATALRRGLVRRSALLDRLSAAADMSLALLVAPPGRGGRAEHRVGPIEDADNDPRRLLDRIASALVAADAGHLETPTVKNLNGVSGHGRHPWSQSSPSPR